MFQSQPNSDPRDRVGAIALELKQLVLEHKPEMIALERVFAQANLRSVMGVAQVSGALMSIAYEAKIPLQFFTPSEVKAAVTQRGVDYVALLGYSHGGGSVYEVSDAMHLDPISFDLKYTAYIDAIKQPFTGIDAEDRRPRNSDFHVNYFQNGTLADAFLNGAESLPVGPGFWDNVDTPTVTETHLSIDDNTTIQTSIINYLKTSLPQP
jgi:hypothetical protein